MPLKPSVSTSFYLAPLLWRGGGWGTLNMEGSGKSSGGRLRPPAQVSTLLWPPPSQKLNWMVSDPSGPGNLILTHALGDSPVKATYRGRGLKLDSKKIQSSSELPWRKQRALAITARPPGVPCLSLLQLEQHPFWLIIQGISGRGFSALKTLKHIEENN